MRSDGTPEPASPMEPVPLAANHNRDDFDCGVAGLNDFLKRYALQNQSGGSARTFVLIREERIVAYFSLAPSGVSPESAPTRITKGQPRHLIPVILMARFAIDKSYQGKGLGRTLFYNALLRALRGAEHMGGRAFFTQAKDETAKQFYLHMGMEPSQTNPLELFLLLKDARATLKALGWE